MRKLMLLPSLLFLAAVALPPLSATTVLPIADGALADQASVIAEGTVIWAGPATAPGHPATAAGRPSTEYRLRVERQVKGEVPGGVAVVRVPGGTAANGMRLKIWGAPEMRIGERALLFLVPNPDGSFGALHLTMGAFHELRSGAGRLAVRNLSEVYQVGAEGSSEPVRDLGRFSNWLADRAAGIERDADYLTDGPGVKQALGTFTYLAGKKQHWVEFSGGESVPWHAFSGGQPLLPGGGFAEFEAALMAWTNDPGSRILYRYAGTTNRTTGFSDSDGLNSILFEDPNSDAPGSFSCPRPGSGSGVLAVGGTWFNDGPAPIAIGEGDIVVNDGAGCWFTSGKRAEQVYGHELGHTLGFGHSCGDDNSGPCNTTAKEEALMRASAHPDNRGAKLGDDDRAAAFDVYPDPNGGGSNRPEAPSNLTVDSTSTTSVTLSWTDNSNNETQFFVEQKKNGKFKSVKTTKANVTTVTITGLQRGKSFTFRVSAKKNKTASTASNEVTVQTRS